MATIGDIGVSAATNILSALIFLLAFAILRLQPLNDRVYFPKWYLAGLRNDPLKSGGFVKKVVNLDWKAYIRFLNWVPAALKMPELELIDHAGLDSAVYLRIYLLGYACLSNYLLVYDLFQHISCRCNINYSIRFNFFILLSFLKCHFLSLSSNSIWIGGQKFRPQDSNGSLIHYTRL